MRIITIDDEPKTRQLIRSYGDRFSPVAVEWEEAGEVAEGVQKILSFKPHLVFLDVNIQGGTGFDILDRIGVTQISFQVIFISAYSDYAVRAFKFSALDYLVKPIDLLDFERALTKAQQSTEAAPNPAQISHLQKMWQSSLENKLVLKDQHSIHIVDINDIVRCESESNYTHFYLMDDTKLTISRTMKEFVDILKDQTFFRPHKSHLINLRHMLKFDKREGGTIAMRNGSNVPLARARKDIFLQLLDKYL
jgi:two-component system LytT family response regulator